MNPSHNKPNLRLVRPPEDSSARRVAARPESPPQPWRAERPEPLPMGVVEGELLRRRSQAYRAAATPRPVARAAESEPRPALPVSTDAIPETRGSSALARDLAPAAGEPITDPLDPRWLLAVHVAQKLDGSVLLPEHRESLVREGVESGMSPFEANLVIAIVQDKARRGVPPVWCPMAGEEQLRMITPPSPAKNDRAARWMLRASWIALAIFAAEAALLAWVLR